MSDEYAWFDKGDGRQVYRRVESGPAPKRSSLSAPMVISDTMEPTLHPCTGEIMTSKSRYRGVTRAHGCIEVGNDPARHRPREKPKPDRKQIRDTVAKARARFNRGERVNPA